jgi:hypothetical protein
MYANNSVSRRWAYANRTGLVRPPEPLPALLQATVQAKLTFHSAVLTVPAQDHLPAPAQSKTLAFLPPFCPKQVDWKAVQIGRIRRDYRVLAENKAPRLVQRPIAATTIGGFPFPVIRGGVSVYQQTYFPESHVTDQAGVRRHREVANG